MVFQPISIAEATLEEEEQEVVVEEEEEKEEDSLSSMASVPAKSKPLHNFSLPQHLKWGKNQVNNQRCRKPNINESSRGGDSSSVDHQQNQIHQNRASSASDVESDGGSSQKEQDIPNQKNTVGSRAGKNRFPGSTCSNGVGGGGGGISGSPLTNKADEVKPSNLVIRIPKGSKEESASKNKSVVAAAGGGGNGGGIVVAVEGGVAEGIETEEPVGKPWNLRPRRAVAKTNNNNNNENCGGVTKNGGEGEMEEKQENQQPKSLRLKRGVVDTENVEKKKKEKKIIFSISLSREDIEDDFYMLTGSKPPRRPKKRNRVVQKQLDNFFPGLWLSGISADSYSVPEVPAKKLKA